jgi:regulator of replication initiation timing|tara:strand:- start:786 stop:983 length:198 start_codon:yes stop_codon:yes gene_type:complete
MTEDIYEKTLAEKEKEVHILRVRVKELVEEVSVLKTELKQYKRVQSDFGYDLVVENPDAEHIKNE